MTTWPSPTLSRHGHRYGPDAANGRVALGAPANWTGTDTRAQRAVIGDTS